MRRALLAVGRALYALLARVEVHGRENLPQAGPLLLAGNHTGAVEATLLALYLPFPVEFLGSGDIPLDPALAWIGKAYGFVPINRGNLDREGLKRALDVLDHGDVLAVFPEGGIWQPGRMRAQVGVAWLSYEGHVRVVPVGFGGVTDAIAQMVRLKRPRLRMTIGKPMAPIEALDETLSKKTALQNAAGEILAEIQKLVPVDELTPTQAKPAVYGFDVSLRGKLEIRAEEAPPLQITHARELGRLLLQPVIMDVYHRNLRLPVDGLMDLPAERNAEDVITACKAIEAYGEKNRGFLTYRFGVDEGIAMMAGVNELRKTAEYARENGYTMFLCPVEIKGEARDG